MNDIDDVCEAYLLIKNNIDDTVTLPAKDYLDLVKELQSLKRSIENTKHALTTVKGKFLV